MKSVNFQLKAGDNLMNMQVEIHGYPHEIAAAFALAMHTYPKLKVIIEKSLLIGNDPIVKDLFRDHPYDITKIDFMQ